MLRDGEFSSGRSYDDDANVQEQMIGQLSTNDRLQLFSHVPMSTVHSVSYRSMLSREVMGQSCSITDRFSDSTRTCTVTELRQLVCQYCAEFSVEINVLEMLC